MAEKVKEVKKEEPKKEEGGQAENPNVINETGGVKVEVK